MRVRVSDASTNALAKGLLARTLRLQSYIDRAVPTATITDMGNNLSDCRVFFAYSGTDYSATWKPNSPVRVQRSTAAPALTSNAAERRSKAMVARLEALIAAQMRTDRPR